MFEKIVIRRHSQFGEPIDAGLLAETLLFYEHVYVLFDQGNLSSLLRSVGPDTLLTLFDQGRISGTYLSDDLGVVTNNEAGIPYHDLAAFRISGDRDGREIGPKDWIRQIFDRELGGQYGSGRKAKHFIERVTFRSHNSKLTTDGILELARTDVNDKLYLRAATEAILKQYIPNLTMPPKWNFDAIRIGQQFVTTTNLDFSALNLEYHKVIPPEKNSLSPGWILANILQARADMYFAADYMAELAVDDTHSKLVKLRMADLLKRRFASGGQIEEFQDVNFGAARAIREAINSGAHSFDDFLRLLDKSAKFKHWLVNQNPDVSLINEYYLASVADTWAESLPTKFLRFVFSTLAGLLAGPAAGAAIGLSDALFTDKLLKGWRPNQFVQGPLRRFVDTE